MKKVFSFAALLTVGLSISAYAVQTIPMDSHGNPLEPLYAGISTCEITSSTGTAAVLCGTAGSGIILQVIGSSVATTDAIVFRDSNTANTSSAVLLTIDQKSLAARNIYPRFNNGLSANCLTAPTGSGSASRPAWTIIYSKDLK